MVVVPVLRTADELPAERLVEPVLRTPVEELPRTAEELFLVAAPVVTPLVVRLRTADDETAAVLVPEVRRPSILAVDAREVRAVLAATRLLLPARRADVEVMLLLAARRPLLLAIAIA